MAGDSDYVFKFRSFKSNVPSIIYYPLGSTDCFVNVYITHKSLDNLYMFECKPVETVLHYRDGTRVVHRHKILSELDSVRDGAIFTKTPATIEYDNFVAIDESGKKYN